MAAKFPQYLTQPYQVLWFEPDDMIFAYGGLMIFGFLLGGWGWLLVPAVPIGYSRLKKGYPRGFIKHLFYFLGLLRFDHYPSALEQEFNE